MDKALLRQRVVDEFRSLVFGPRGGKEEFVEGVRGVTLRYMTGILFPRGQKRTDLAAGNESFSEEASIQSGMKAGQDDFSGDAGNSLSMANEELPSSVGISFVVEKGASFRILIECAIYEAGELHGEKGFQRKPFEQEVIDSENVPLQGLPVFKKRGSIHLIRRKSYFNQRSEVVTVSLVNEKEQSKKGKYSLVNIESRLYQVKMQCIVSADEIQKYEVSEVKKNSFEEQILATQYTDYPIYAVGHGASVLWSIGDQESTVEISYLPSVVVNRPLFDRLEVNGQTYEKTGAFDISKLANDSSDRDEILADFDELFDIYDQWIDFQGTLAKGGYQKAEGFLLEEFKKCLGRARQGINHLRNNDDYWQAFVLANKAMLYQIDQNQRSKALRASRESAGLRWPVDWTEQINTKNLEFPVFGVGKEPRWRPFQLAFFLTTYLGLEEGHEDDRQQVSLIWFSTGGGKTEAYFLLASYELIRRRTRYGDGSTNPELGFGTGVLTRYTLRFLTSDQFARTASLGCGLEKVRIENLDLLGSEPLSVGLYVGTRSTSYRTIAQVQTALNDLALNLEAEHRFQIHECPNCGTGIIPKENQRDEDGTLLGLGVKLSSTRSLVYECANKNCIFSGELNIPLKVVDEEIYDSPPSFLLGTIDKFAMVAWKDQSGRIFGKRRQGYVVPPSLVIQDELHLISGPLGTIAAVYEAGFDQLIKVNQSLAGLEPIGPKYIASSATVRDSNIQIRRLMGRSSSIFPPRGLRSHDSFFSKLDDDPDKGRLYVGLMAQGLRSTSAAHWASGALLQAVRYVAREVESKEELDFLWTALCYCNSKRELGLINAAVNQEILDRIRVCAEAQRVDQSEITYLRKEEVSSDAVDNIATTRGSLLVSVHNNEDSDVKDFVPCTNMISVGIDIDRLGLIIVNGQPKTTAEYIQATSRVGRNPTRNGPGLVLTLYSPAKPRDRSHYEHFRSYHETLHRLVEPTSVTPGSQPALERALHASLITLVRHGRSGMSANAMAVRFDAEDENTLKLIDEFKARLLQAYPDREDSFYERRNIESQINKIVEDWSKWTAQPLKYAETGVNGISLLKKFGENRQSNIGFSTMQSMRGVDAEVLVKNDQ